MKKKRYIVYTVLLLQLLFFTKPGMGQQFALDNADRLYRMYAYGEAVEQYERLLNRDPENEYLIQQLAYSYDKMGLYEKALAYFEKHVQGKRARYEDLYKYASLLLIDQQFERAIEEFEKCIERRPNDERPKAQIERIRGFEQLNLLHLVDTVFNLSFNTRFSDMSPAFFKDSIAFVSARDSSGNNTYSWNNQPFLDIYQFGKDKQGETEIQKMPGVNTKFHEGPLVFTNNDSTMYFTRNNQSYSRSQGTSTNNLRIYTAQWKGKKWQDIEEFQYNGKGYSVGHPSLSKDGNTLYFASNMNGTLGDTDLFYCERKDTIDKKGNKIWYWTAPKNMGTQFNTEGKEMFPYVDSRGIIFFASDGLIGFGGLDIFAAYPLADTFNVINLGQPINSTYDDFGFIVDDDFNQGYFSSNRAGGKGSDDLYNFYIGEQHLYLNVKSLGNNEPVKDARVYLTKNGERKFRGLTNEAGSIDLVVDFNSKYFIEAENDGYLPNTDSLEVFELFKIPDHTKTIYLDKLAQLNILCVNKENEDPLSGVKVVFSTQNTSEEFLSDQSGKVNKRLEETGEIKLTFSKSGFVSQEKTVLINDLMSGNISVKTSMEPIYEGKTFTLENLYYDVNSSLIREDAKLVLDELYKILIEFPTMKIELGSHTDCRAKAEYNQWLSQKRAQSAVDYLVSKGIERGRMTPVGYGESKLLNRCADGVECSEEEHQVNRRTEFRVLEF